MLNSLRAELREIVWLTLIVAGLSIAGVTLAVALVTLPSNGYTHVPPRL